MFRDQMKNPLYAAAFAALVTAVAVHVSQKPQKNSEYVKPALFVGALVYLIMYQGNGEAITKEPF